jgi:hypothetical protein
LLLQLHQGLVLAVVLLSAARVALEVCKVREVVVGGGQEVGRHLVRNDIHTGHLVLLFPLHPPVLEPDLDLPFRQAERVRDFDASPPRQVAVEVELLLQLQSLVACVRRPLSLRLAVGVHRACKHNNTNFRIFAIILIRIRAKQQMLNFCLSCKMRNNGYYSFFCCQIFFEISSLKNSF